MFTPEEVYTLNKSTLDWETDQLYTSIRVKGNQLISRVLDSFKARHPTRDISYTSGNGSHSITVSSDRGTYEVFTDFVYPGGFDDDRYLAVFQPLLQLMEWLDLMMEPFKWVEFNDYNPED